MNRLSKEQNQLLLQNLMQQANIADIRELSKIAGVRELQLVRLQLGLISQMSLPTIIKIAKGLQISVDKLLTIFMPDYVSNNTETTPAASDTPVTETFWKHEYQRLEAEVARQKESLQEEFQNTSLQIIESWLVQWPTAVAAVQKNPQLPAERLLPLIQPLQQLLQEWEIETIALVGEKLPYDPRWHTLHKGSAEPGELVEVRYVGYKQGDKLLHKAKVSSIDNLN
jgi:molecular chaperone GrpE (heat shock protein)